MSINPQETYVLNSESTAKLLAKLDGDDRQKKEKKKKQRKKKQENCIFFCARVCHYGVCRKTIIMGVVFMHFGVFCCWITVLVYQRLCFANLCHTCASRLIMFDFFNNNLFLVVCKMVKEN
jgi:hypothetical protein